MAWFVPALMALGTVTTILGQQQQKKAIKNNLAWKRYDTKLQNARDKIIHDKNLAKLLSEQRARTAASRVQFTGSPILVAQNDIDEAKEEWMFGQIQRDNALIAAENEAGSMLTKLSYDQLAAGISLGANVKNYQTNLEIAKKVGVKTG
tara:strand:+ start:700 stop:1146 length:447 start_codon:yes stop_codon:yes gene_type:complete